MGRACSEKPLPSGDGVVTNVIYGVWLENSFGLQVVALGAASMLIGLAELSGVGLVARLTDPLGKIRALCLGILSITFACLLLPFLGGSLIPRLDRTLSLLSHLRVHVRHPDLLIHRAGTLRPCHVDGNQHNRSRRRSGIGRADRSCAV